MHAFDVLGDPVRRRILELLVDGERTAGEIGVVVQEEFGISQPGVSQHLKVLRESGFTTVRPDGNRRFYAVQPEPLQEIDRWLGRYRQFWAQRLDALETELVRGRRVHRTAADPVGPPAGGAAERAEEPSSGRKTIRGRRAG